MQPFNVREYIGDGERSTDYANKRIEHRPDMRWFQRHIELRWWFGHDIEVVWRLRMHGLCWFGAEP